MVYAGNDTGVYRWTVGTSSSWKSIKGATMVVGLGVGADGTLYAASRAAFVKPTPFVAASGDVLAKPARWRCRRRLQPRRSRRPARPSSQQLGVTGTGDDNLMRPAMMVGGFAHTNTGGSERLWVSITNPGRHGYQLRRRQLAALYGHDRKHAAAGWLDSRRRGGGRRVQRRTGSGVIGFKIGWDAVVWSDQLHLPVEHQLDL